MSVAQPSLSLSVKKLESELNVVLVDRSSYQFQLTEEGQRLFEILKPAFETIEENITFNNNEKKYLELNIGISLSYARVVLSEVIKKFREENPQIKINVDIYSKLDEDKVRNGDYDIVIDDKIAFKHLENVTIESIYNLNNHFVCGSGLYEEFKDIKSILEFGIVPFISYKPSLKTGEFRKLCYQNNFKLLEIVSVNESDLYFELLKENVGLGFSNDLLLKKYVNNKTLHVIDVNEEIFSDVLGALYIKDSEIIHKFIDMVKEYVVEEMK